MNVMDRLAKLLAMAESPVEEEARTAAFLAVKLIKEHKIELRMPSASGHSGQSAPGQRRVPVDVDAAVRAWAAYEASARARAASQQGRWSGQSRHTWASRGSNKSPPNSQGSGPGQNPAPDPASSPDPASGPDPARSKKAADVFRIITTSYDGNCRACGGRYLAGERVFWKRGEGAIHESCGPEF